MKDVAYRCAAALRLGLPMPLSGVIDAVNGQVKCECGDVTSGLGHHALICQLFLRTVRHHHIKNVLYNTVLRIQGLCHHVWAAGQAGGTNGCHLSSPAQLARRHQAHGLRHPGAAPGQAQPPVCQ